MCAGYVLCDCVFVSVCVKIKEKHLNGDIRFETPPLLGCVTVDKLLQLSVTLLSHLVAWES